MAHGVQCFLYTVRNKIPDPSVSFTEILQDKSGCSSTVRGTTNLHVFVDDADKCREYATIVAEQDLIDADGFTAFYPIAGRGPGNTCIKYGISFDMFNYDVRGSSVSSCNINLYFVKLLV